MDSRAIARSMVPRAATCLHTPRDPGARRRARVRRARARWDSHDDFLHPGPCAALSGLDDAVFVGWFCPRAEALRALVSGLPAVGGRIAVPAFSPAVEPI